MENDDEDGEHPPSDEPELAQLVNPGEALLSFQGCDHPWVHDDPPRPRTDTAATIAAAAHTRHSHHGSAPLCSTQLLVSCGRGANAADVPVPASPCTGGRNNHADGTGNIAGNYSPVRLAPAW